MTGYFAQGKCRKYGYYKCQQRTCPTRTKSYSAPAAHQEFDAFLAEASLPGFVTEGILAALIRNYWDDNETAHRTRNNVLGIIEGLRRQLQELITMRRASNNR
jgi:hypothetical protein